MSTSIEKLQEEEEPGVPKRGRPTVLTLERVIEVVAEHDREGREVSIRSVQRGCGGSQETVKAMLERIGRLPLKVEREPDVHDGLVKAMVKGIEDHSVRLRQECQRKIDAVNGLLEQELQKRVTLANDLRERQSDCVELQVENGVLQGLLFAERQASRQAAATAETEKQRADVAEANCAIAQQSVAKLEGELLGVMEAKNVRDHDYHLLSEQNKRLFQTLNQLASDRNGDVPL